MGGRRAWSWRLDLEKDTVFPEVWGQAGASGGPVVRAQETGAQPGVKVLSQGPLLPGRGVSPSQTQPLPARAVSLLHAQWPQAEALRRSVWRPAQRAPGQGQWARSPPGQDLHGRGELLAPHQSS